MNKPDIRNISEETLLDFLIQNNEKPFRLKQLNKWLWHQFVWSFDEMKNLPKPFIEKLKTTFELTFCTVIKIQKSTDGTIKAAFKLFDEEIIEGVIISENERLTACLSTQVGCPMKCNFCATAQLGFKRNLTAAEIMAHFILLNTKSIEVFGKSLTNVVLMGMGEPLLNYDNVSRFVKKINDADGFNFSAKRITLSTVGIVDGIKRLADENLRIKLALSLHAVNDEVRNNIIPYNKQNGIDALIKTLEYYYNKTKNRVTFEYILMKGVNDSRTDAMKLAEICRKVPSKVNLIEFNAFQNSLYEKSDPTMTANFCRILTEQGVNCRLRKSKGENIDAACGQLANKGV